MSSGLPHPPGLDDSLGYPFFQSVFDRKSRRMGLGMSMPGTLGYDSPYEAVPLTELEEALLLVVGTGLTGLNLGDIDPSMGADAMVQWTARTWPSSCSNHGTELFFTNDDGLYFLDMWNLMPEDGEISTLQNKGRDAQVDFILQMVRGAKKQLEDGRAEMPEGLPGLFVFNHWNANKPGTTLFLPVSNMTLEYINLLFIYFSPEYRFTLVDETNGYQPCGLQKWVDSGRLDATARWGSSSWSSASCRCRSSSRRSSARTSPSPCRRWASAAGPTPATSPASPSAAWTSPASASASPTPSAAPASRSAATGSSRRSPRRTTPTWARRSTRSSSASGRSTSRTSRSRTSSRTRWSRQIERPTDETIQIVKDYCQYVHDTYGRFPAYLDPMYQRLTCQAQHVNTDFYAQYYPPGAVTDQHHQHFERWHPELAGDDGRPPLRGNGAG